MGQTQEKNSLVQQQVGFLIKRLQQALRNRMDEALSKKGLTTSQYAVLSHLREAGSLTNAELARRSFVTAPTMIRIVQDLEILQFIERTESKSHAKVVDVTLSQKGKRVIETCDSIVKDIQKQMLENLSPAEINKFSSFLITCARSLES